MNSGRAAPLLADPPGISPLVLEPDPHLLAGREGAVRRREDIEPRAVLGRDGLPSMVQDSFSQCGPPVSRTSSSGWSLAIDQVVCPRDVIAAPLGKQVEVELDVLEIGDPGVAVGGQVLAPVILFLFLGRAAFVSPAHLERQPDAGDERDAPPRAPAVAPPSESAAGSAGGRRGSRPTRGGGRTPASARPGRPPGSRPAAGSRPGPCDRARAR